MAVVLMPHQLMLFDLHAPAYVLKSLYVYPAYIHRALYYQKRRDVRFRLSRRNTIGLTVCNLILNGALHLRKAPRNLNIAAFGCEREGGREGGREEGREGGREGGREEGREGGREWRQKMNFGNDIRARQKLKQRSFAISQQHNGAFTKRNSVLIKQSLAAKIMTAYVRAFPQNDLWGSIRGYSPWKALRCVRRSSHVNEERFQLTLTNSSIKDTVQHAPPNSYRRHMSRAMLQWAAIGVN